MKKIFFILAVGISILLLSSCTKNKNSSIEPASSIKEAAIGYKIEKIVLSRGYQSIEPKVEIINKNDSKEILASLGLIECSGVTIDKITKVDNEIKIYTNRLLDNDKVQLVVPQLIFSLEDSDILKSSDVRFKIINQNYKPINLKFNRSQILNNIYSNFKISQSTIPNVNLIKSNDTYIWDINFNNIFDRDSLKLPLMNFTVQADANTGEILSSNKDIVSTYIDDGEILDYISDKYLLYKREEKKDDEIYNNLYVYNINTEQKEKIYTTNNIIRLAKFSPDSGNISLIENDDNITNIYLVNLKDKIIKKITPHGYNHTWSIKWKDKENLYFINNDTNEKSTLFDYNLSTNEAEQIFLTTKNVSDFDFIDNSFLITEFDADNINKNIYLTNDGVILNKIDTGYRATFLDNKTILYLKNIQDKNTNVLCIYHIDSGLKTIEDKLNLEDYTILKDNKLTLVAKNSCNDDFDLIEYDILSGDMMTIANVTSPKVFCNSNNNVGYLSLTPPLEDSKRSIVYSIDLEKLKTNKNK